MSIYKRVYFRIKTPIYYSSSGVGFQKKQDQELFHNTIRDLFLNDGWEIKKEWRSGSCTSVLKDKQDLYLHPQEVTGVVAEGNISHIENLLGSTSIFSFRKTDIYEDVFDITDEEYMNILKSKIDYIEQDLLDAYKTKRSNLYITSSSPISNVLDKYRIKRLSNFVGVYSNSNIDWLYVNEIFESLVSKGKIISAKTKSGIGYRTRKDKEKKSA